MNELEEIEPSMLPVTSFTTLVCFTRNVKVKYPKLRDTKNCIRPRTFIVKLWEEDHLINGWPTVIVMIVNDMASGKTIGININTMAYPLIVISNDANYLSDVYSPTNRYV